MNEADIRELESAVGHTFLRRDWLLEALTHSSFYNENKGGTPCNERLEFLGDAVLGLITSQYLFENDQSNEGVLSRTKSALVDETANCRYARALNLGKYIRFGKGEQKSGGTRPRTLNNAFEALVAAVYLDGGLDAARAFVLPFLTRDYADVRDRKDNKTLLQEFVQKNPGDVLSYAVTGEQGPDHNKTYVVSVCVNSNAIASGEGKSIKAAEEDAAGKALVFFGVTGKEK